MKLRISDRDRTLALRFQDLTRDLRHKISVALVEGNQLLLDLDPGELEALARAGARACSRTRNPKTRRAIETLLDKIRTAEKIPGPHKPGSLDSSVPPPSIPDDPEDLIIEKARRATPGWDEMDVKSRLQILAETNEFRDFDHFQRVGQKLFAEHNESPLPGFGGVSPRQLHLLLYGGWEQETPGVQIQENLPDETVAEAPIIRYALAVMKALIEEGGAKTTAKGNLNRKFVSRMVAEMGLPEEFLEDLFFHNKVINESDVWPLEELRIVLELGKLIRKYRGRFVATRLGRRLIEPGQLGRLFALLFHTKFRVFNLAYHDRLADLPEFQQFLGFSLFRLNSLKPGRWIDLEKEAPSLMHPDLAATLPVMELEGGYKLDHRKWMVRSRLLRHMVDFGLVEFARERKQSRSRPRITPDRFRTTKLFPEFVKFNFAQGGSPKK